jgi:hypothetical protein
MKPPLAVVAISALLIICGGAVWWLNRRTYEGDPAGLAATDDPDAWFKDKDTRLTADQLTAFINLKKEEIPIYQQLDSANLLRMKLLAANSSESGQLMDGGHFDYEGTVSGLRAELDRLRSKHDLTSEQEERIRRIVASAMSKIGTAAYATDPGYADARKVLGDATVDVINGRRSELDALRAQLTPIHAH